MILVVAMLLTMVPAQVLAATQEVAYDATSRNNTTITVTDENGSPINNATVTVTRTTTSYWNTTTYNYNYEVYTVGSNGQYKFTRNTTSSRYSYTVTVSADGYDTETITVKGNSSSASVELVSNVPVQEIGSFNIFYVADGSVPSNGYAGANDAADYGPSADNTPLVTINVNLTMLKAIAEQDNAPVVYIVSGSSGNQYEFTPAGSHTDADFKDKMLAFWEAVLSCVESESIELFEETGLFDEFVGYCLKKQRDGSMHLDGILDVRPPVYVVELYQNETYFGGATTDQDTSFPTAYNLLDQYEAHLKQNITWEENSSGKPLRKEKADGTEYYTGTYIDTATSKIHVIEVYQFDDDNAAYVSNPKGDSEIPYVKRTNTYYIAKFNMSVDAGTSYRFTVTYTDGVTSESVFNDHEYVGERYQQVPAFTGVTIREDYIFTGWVLEGDTSGTLYSDEDIAKMTVTGNMVFHAAWVPVPKYTGTVMFVLNGTYDSTTATLTGGTLVDPAVLGGTTQEVLVGVSADGTEYIPLEKTAAGTYSAVLENGTYSIYYSLDGGASWLMQSQQLLTIENQDRVRYLFFNDVIYDPNGGTLDGSTDGRTEYYLSGNSVSVYGNEPVREGYLFAGWKIADGTVYGAGQTLLNAIDRSYTLTAQWIEATDVYVHLTLNHVDYAEGINESETMHNVSFTVDYRTGDSGDYTEIYEHQILWDGEGAYSGEGYEATYVSRAVQSYTTYTPTAANLTGVDKTCQYTVTVTKPGYELRSVMSEYDENGDLHLYAELVWTPADFDLVFSVELDDAAKQLENKSLWPAAVNVKVTRWFDTPFDDSKTVDWFTVTRQQETYERVALDSTGCGTGTYPVWIGTDDGEKAYYRMEVVSYELQDGTVVPAEDIGGAHVQYDAPNKLYKARVEVSGGADPDTTDSDALTGVWYENDAQQGTLKTIVSIPVFTVTFMPNGGLLNGSYADTVLTEQIFYPEEASYTPTRDGGYLFEGWYVLEDGQMSDYTVPAGTYLTEDLVLIAKWREPIRVEGTVSVAATYEQTDAQGNTVYKTVPEADRATHVEILLQKKTPSGYYETVEHRNMTLDYSNSGYYYQGRTVGIAFYSFSGLPDDGTQYRINILSANYTTTYQNEPESADFTSMLQYNTYTVDRYDALMSQLTPGVATVNAHLHFAPPSFDLIYQVDATRIGKDFRPESAQVLVTCDADPAIVAPEDWEVITQMVFDGVAAGDHVALSAGFGESATSVWEHAHDGATLYDYGIRLQSTTHGGVATDYVKGNPYFSVTYQAPAHYVDAAGSQSQILVANLIPNAYAVTYEPNGGTLYGLHTHTHTWSFDTNLSDVVPVRNGYSFAGWYTDEALTQPLTDNTIPAEVAQDVTVYAKWVQVHVHLQVYIDHTTDDQGLAGNYEKLLHAQLTEKFPGQESYVPVANHEKTYDKTVWHTQGDGAARDVVEIPHFYSGLSHEKDYAVEISMEGYYNVESLLVDFDEVDSSGQSARVEEVVTAGVTKTVSQDGTEIEYLVVACLKFDPDTMDLLFSVEMAEDVELPQYPVSADVKVTCWGVLPEDQSNLDWQIISQHKNSVVTVPLDPATGKGIGTYPVWRWLNQENAEPYYYRIEVVGLTLQDGTGISLTEQVDEFLYTGSGYSATVYAEDGCLVPGSQTAMAGAYGVAETHEDGTTIYHQVGALRAVIDAGRVVFHANNAQADDVFRTYYPGAGEYRLNGDGTVPAFYDIPTFDYLTHNEYIFKGWYTAADESGEAVDWTQAYTGTDPVHLYAHWIETGTVQQAEDDAKQLPEEWNGTYQGYDLVGIQVRSSETDDAEHYGEVGSGLRFITVLSKSVYDQINSLPGNEGGAEYGFVMAKAMTVPEDTQELLYKGKNVNGQDTRTDYSYAINLKCSGVADHFSAVDADGNVYYRLYTGVVTYKSAAAQGEEVLQQAYSQNMVARAYIRYYDANGLLRTYHSNYTGNSRVGGGCSASYNMAMEMVGQ